MKLARVKRSWWIPATLVADALLFFARPLFLRSYVFPWDFRSVQVPLIAFLAAQLKRGEFALWDPYTYCGNPVYANIQAAYFHPLVFLSALVSNWTGPDTLPLLLEWAVVLQVCIGGLATYMILRDLGASRAASWAAGAMCQTGAYFASRPEHIGAMMAAAWAPVAWLAVLRLHRGWDAKMLALLGLSLGLSILAGLPAVSFAVFLSVLLLAAVLLDRRVLLLAATGCVLGVGLAAVEFIPAAELTANSVAKYRADWLGTGGGLKWESLVSLAAPDHYHIFDLARFHGPWDPSFLYLYCGLGGLAFAVIGLIRKRDRWTVTFAVLAVAGGVFMLGDSTAPWRAIYPLLPEQIRIGIHPEYSYFIFGECLAILAGLGLSRTIRSAKAQWFFAVLIAADLYLVGSNRPMNTAHLSEQPTLDRIGLEGIAGMIDPARKLLDGRIDTMNASIDWAQSATLTRVPTGSGCSPLAPERVIQLRLGLHDGGRSGWYYPVANPESTALDLLSEKYLVVGGDAGSVAKLSKFRKVGELPGATIFENTTARPRTYLTAKGTARIMNETADSLSILVNATAASSLVVSDTWYPGWQATLDGHPTEIVRTNVAFRGVAIPAGQHRVEMRFRPKILVWSALISAIFAGVLAVLTAAGWRRA